MIKFKCVFLILSILFLFGCTSSFRPGAQEYTEIYRIYDTDKAAAEQKLSSYSPEKQVQIYLYASCCIEGGPGSMLSAFFDEKNLPAIMNRIEVFPDNIQSKVALIEALQTINRKCQCLKKHPEYIKNLEEIEEKLKTGKTSSDFKYREDYIKFYSDYLSEIKKES